MSFLASILRLMRFIGRRMIANNNERPQDPEEGDTLKPSSSMQQETSFISWVSVDLNTNDIPVDGCGIPVDEPDTEVSSENHGASKNKGSRGTGIEMPKKKKSHKKTLSMGQPIVIYKTEDEETEFGYDGNEKNKL